MAPPRRTKQLFFFVAVLFFAMTMFLGSRLRDESIFSGGSRTVSPSSQPPELASSSFGPSATFHDGSFSPQTTAIVVIAYNRPKALRRCLNALMSLPEIPRYSVIVSQDGVDAAVADVARSVPGLSLVQRTDRTPLLSANQAGHAYLAQHYKYILDILFLQRNFSHVIVLEDDLEVSVDFLHLFESTAVVLQEDSSLFCVSAWNDYGFTNVASDAQALYRTQFFPGLGWMIARKTWMQFSPTFPLDQWDNWMRVPGNVGPHASCIFPEIPRTFHFEKGGANTETAHYQRFLSNMVRSSERAEFGDVSYLLRSNYDQHLQDLIGRAERVELTGLLSLPERPGGCRAWRQQVLEQDLSAPVFLLPFFSEQFGQIAEALNVIYPMRTHYEHTMLYCCRGNFAILADRRLSPFVPEDVRVYAPESLTPLAGQPGESCTSVCAKKSFVCRNELFDFVNDCELLRKTFGCPRGFGQETGADIPCFVPPEMIDSNAGRCLFALGSDYVCPASHPATRRLCPCAQT